MKTHSLGQRIIVFLVSMSPLAIWLLILWLVIPSTAKLPYQLSMLILASLSVPFATIIGYLIFKIALPLSGRKVDDTLKKLRTWLIIGIIMLGYGAMLVSLSFIYDVVTPMVPADDRHLTLPLVTILAITLLLIPPLFRNKTIRFLEHLLQTEKIEKNTKKSC